MSETFNTDDIVTFLDSTYNLPAGFSPTANYKIMEQSSINKLRNTYTLTKLESTPVKLFGRNNRFSDYVLKKTTSKCVILKVGDTVQKSDNQMEPSNSLIYKITEIPQLDFKYKGTYTMKTLDPKNNIIYTAKLKEIIPIDITRVILPSFMKGQFLKKIIDNSIHYIHIIDNNIYTLFNISTQKPNNITRTIMTNNSGIAPYNLTTTDSLADNYEIISLKFKDSFLKHLEDNNNNAAYSFFTNLNKVGFNYGGLNNAHSCILFKDENNNTNLLKNRYGNNFYTFVETGKNLLKVFEPFEPNTKFKGIINKYSNVKNNIKNIKANKKNINTKIIASAKTFYETHAYNNKYFSTNYSIGKKMGLEHIIDLILKSQPITIPQNLRMIEIINKLIQKYNNTPSLMILTTLTYIVDRIYMYKEFFGDNTSPVNQRIIYLQAIINNFPKSNFTTYYFRDYIIHVINALEITNAGMPEVVP